MINGYMIDLPSSSNITTAAALGTPRVTSSGSEVGSIISLKDSVASNILSSFIGTLSKAVVFPAVNVTLYDPEV